LRLLVVLMSRLARLELSEHPLSKPPAWLPLLAR
jgi:hypothetical protein